MTAHVIELVDSVPLSVIRKTKDGYVVATPRVARTGIQIYGGDELGIPEFRGKVIRVYRPEDEVFNKDALHSYAHRPVTIGHPKGGVNADNWRETAVGVTGDEVLRDGNFVRVPMTVMDGEAVKAIEQGLLELSMGYSASIELADGVSPEGEPYDAVQRSMRMNHLAIVPRARGGSNLRIGDYQEETTMADAIKTRTVLVDGLPVETTDAGAIVIERLQSEVKALKDAASTTATETSKTLAVKDAKIADLETKVVSDEAFEKRVNDRIALLTTAKALAPSLKFDGLDEASIYRNVVSALYGDSAVTGKDDHYVKARFDIAADDAAKGKKTDPMRGFFRPGASVVDASGATAGDKAYQKMVGDLQTAYKGE